LVGLVTKKRGTGSGGEQQSRNAKFQIQNSRPEFAEKSARKTTNHDLVLQRGRAAANT
jgi:hypothetical protein